MSKTADIQVPSQLTATHPTDIWSKMGFRVRRANDIEFVLPPMCAILAGPFMMGSDPAKDKLAFLDETPQHEVTTQAYWIGTYPVTVVEYVYAVRNNVVSEPKPFKGITWADQLRTPYNPVTSIRWIDAVLYCAWLSDLTNLSYRLPTEAEWEKAARGTDGRIYPWGNEWDPERTNTPDMGTGAASAVWDYPDGVSPDGVYDMSGNVWEWCSSMYKPYPYGADDGREAVNLTDDRVMRGSSWYCPPRNSRPACRGIGCAGLYLGGGFRVACSEDPNAS